MKSDRNADRHNSSQGIQDGKRGVCVPERNPLARVDQKKKEEENVVFEKGGRIEEEANRRRLC